MVARAEFLERTPAQTSVLSKDAKSAPAPSDQALPSGNAVDRALAATLRKHGEALERLSKA